MRISDWSSDVCSSDLRGSRNVHALARPDPALPRPRRPWRARGFARLRRLSRAAELRLDDRQADRPRRLPRTGHLPHARVADRDGRLRHHDQPPASASPPPLLLFRYFTLLSSCLLFSSLFPSSSFFILFFFLF